MDKYLVCEDSIEGVFSGVYAAYAGKYNHNTTHLCVQEPTQNMLFATFETVKADMALSDKVARTIVREMGVDAYRDICQALASEDERKADAVYHMIVVGITGKMGMHTEEDLSNDYIRTVVNLSFNVNREVQHLHGFLRFEELENKVMFSTIGPKNNIITLLAPHFANRYRNENFIIYDEIRNLFVLHKAGDGDHWVVLSNSQVDVNSEYFKTLSEDEKEYQRCFCHFCEHIAIQSRTNPRCQRTMLPLRFRGYMTEFTR